MGQLKTGRGVPEPRTWNGQIGPLMHQKELKIVFLYQKYPLFCRIFFGDHTLSVEIILNEVSLGGSPVLLSVRTIVKEWDVLCLVTFLHFHTLYHYIYRHHGLSICSSIFATAAQKSCKSKLSNLSLAQTSVVPWKWWNDFNKFTSGMDTQNLSFGGEDICDRSEWLKIDLWWNLWLWSEVWYLVLIGADFSD